MNKVKIIATATLLAGSAYLVWHFTNPSPSNQSMAINNSKEQGQSSQDLNKTIQHQKTIAEAASEDQELATPDTKNKAAYEKYQKEYRDLNLNPEYPNIDMRLAELNARRQDMGIDAEMLLELMAQDSAWQPAAEPAPELNLDPEEIYDGREFITFNANKIETLMPGDSLQINIAQLNADYKMIVESVEVHDDGNVTWRGHLSDFESDNYVSITQNNNMTVAGITTPQGNYTLESREGSGWIVNTDTLFKINPDEEDVIIPQGIDHQQGDINKNHNHSDNNNNEEPPNFATLEDQ